MLIGLLAACLPPVGTLVPMTAEVRAPSGIVVQVFDPGRNDAEFRGCDAGECRIMIHRREAVAGGWRTRPFDERGFGPVVVLPEEALARVVRLPDCAPAPTPETPREVRRPARREGFRLPPLDARLTTPLAPATPPAADPPVAAVIARAVVAAPVEPPAEPYPGLRISAPSEASPAPVEPGRFTTADGRVSGRVLPDGRVQFEGRGGIVPLDDPAPVKGNPWDRIPPLEGGVGVAGEGLNALDGADIYAPQKRAFLEETRAERLALYRRHRRAAELDHSALHAACSAAIRDLEGDARKARLFLLWAEIAPQDDPVAQASAAAARRHVERQIRERLPREAGGYSLAELIELNLCRGPPLFDPYGDPGLPVQVADGCE